MLSYWQVHHRLHIERGPASDFPCSVCGSPAQDWAFRGDQATALVSQRGTGIGCLYSERIWEDYRPECRSCHHTLDMTDERRERGRRLAYQNFPEVWTRKGPRGSTKTNAMRRKCEVCGVVSTPGPLALHQRKLGHTGFSEVS